MHLQISMFKHSIMHNTLSEFPPPPFQIQLRIDYVCLSCATRDPSHYHEMPTQCSVYVGPASTTVTHHRPNIGFCVLHRSYIYTTSLGPYSGTRYDISSALDWSRWPSQPIGRQRYIVTSTRIWTTCAVASDQ